jgi:hypothetical protein
MDATALAALAGLILSLVFSYVPGIKDWFEAQSMGMKQAIMGGLLVVIALVVFGLSCAGLGASLGIGVECSVAGAYGFLQVLIAALVANQSIYLITRK